LKKYNIK